jgi:predicted GIY-YIG superfamily endonuclease
MRKLHDALEIYGNGAIKEIPKFAVYDLADPDDIENAFYVGCSENPEQRYKKHINAANLHSHEGQDKIDRIKAIRARGKRPLMIIVGAYGSKRDMASGEKERKLYWKNKGITLTNEPGKPASDSTRAKVKMGDAIDNNSWIVAALNHPKTSAVIVVVFLVVFLIVLVFISAFIARSAKVKVVTKPVQEDPSKAANFQVLADINTNNNNQYRR